MCVLIYSLILVATLKRTVCLTIQQIKLQFADWDSCTNSFFAVAELFCHAAHEEGQKSW